MLTATIDEKAKTLTVVASLEKPGTKSKSGKTELVASSHGNQATTAQVDGKPVVIGLNAYIK